MKRFLTMLFAVMLLFSSLPQMAQAAGTATIDLKVVADKTVANPGDTITCTVSIGAVEDLGGLDFFLKLPTGLTFVDDSIVVPEGVYATLQAAEDETIIPTKDSKLRWCHTAGRSGYTGTEPLILFTFTCTVDEDASFEEKELDIYGDNETTYPERVDPALAFDNSLAAISINIIPAKVTVAKKPVFVSGVTLNKTSLSLKDGESEALVATISPSDADNQNVTWTSSQPEVATVVDGTVTAVKPGDAVITVTTEDGSKTATCQVTVSCSHANLVKTEEKASTCTVKGWDAYYTCNVCTGLFAEDGVTAIETIPERDLAAHDYTKEEVAAKYLKSAGTCQDEAVYYKSCTMCGEKGTDTFEGQTDASNHAETKVINQKAATCEEEGYSGDTQCTGCQEIVATGQVLQPTGHAGGKATCQAKAVCSTCGQPYGDLGGHGYVEKVEEKYLKSEGTCQVKAVYYKSCEVCGVKSTDTFEGELAAHDFTKEEIAAKYLKSAGTCQTEAVYYKSCTVCGEKGTDTFIGEKDASNHAETKVINQKDATCETTGYTGDTQCTGCQKIVAKGTETAATGHTGGKATCQAKAVCNTCGQSYGDLGGHSYVEKAEEKYLKSEGTCQQAAVYYKSCEVCGEQDTNTFEGELAAHNFSNEIVADKYLKSPAGCVTAAVYYKSCVVCGEADSTSTFTYGSSRGHDIDEDVWKFDAENHWNECACGEKFGYKAHVDVDSNNICDVCGYQIADDEEDDSEPVQEEPKVVEVKLTYTVERGDNLYKIAAKNGITLSRLLELNPQIKNPNLIYKGQVFVVGMKQVAADSEQAKAPEVSVIEKYHVVEKGDNLYKIARQYGIKLNDIYEMNPWVVKQKYIYKNQKIRVK